MNWKVKAAIQRACASLPGGGEGVYYAIQKRFGDLLNRPDPLNMLSECARLTALLRDHQVPVAGARIMEVGTGRRLDMPLGFFLAGAVSTVTCDLHQYLKPELVLQAIERIRAHRETVRAYFAPLTDAAGLDRRLEILLGCKRWEELLERTSIRYLAPCDASASGLPTGSIDIHLSYTVFEHIPGPVLTAILQESNRLLAPGGVALHHIDLSDHFAHADPSISAINFLRYSAPQWQHYAGNQFAYHNRLRPAGYAEIYAAGGHDILRWIPQIDSASLQALRNGFVLDSEFRGQSPEELCTTVLQVLSRPRGGAASSTRG